LSDARLPARLYIDACLRHCSQAGISLFVLRKGDPDRGVILLKASVNFHASRLYRQESDMAGRLVWVPIMEGAALSEADAQTYILRQTGRDPDLWVLEVETRDGANPLP
jgi:hypothetical protein